MTNTTTHSPHSSLDAALWSAAAESHPEAILVVDAHGRISRWNDRAAQLFGLGAADVTGQSLLDPGWHGVNPDGSAVPGDLHPAMLALQSGEAVTGVKIGIRRKDDSVRWVEASAWPLTERDGETTGALASLHDITDDLVTARTAEDNAERFRVAFDRSPVALAVVDETGRFRDANRAISDMFGVDPAQIREMDWITLSELGISNRLAQLLQPPFVTDTVSDVIEYRRPDGLIKHGLTQLSSITWPETDRAAMIEIVDVTELIDSQRAAAVLAEQLRVLFDSSPVGMALVSPEGLFVRANPAMARLHRYQTHELIGRPAQDFVHVDDRAMTERFAARAVEGRAAALDHRAYTSDGDVRWLRTHLTKLDSATDPVLLVQSVDHTAQRRADLALRSVDRTTGLLSRIGIVEQLEQAIVANRRTKARLAVFCVDIDDFREINDRAGVEAADRLLERVGISIQASMPLDALVGRSHGDVFVAVAHLDTLNDTKRTAESVLRALSAITVKDEADPIRCSIGSILIEGTDIDPDDLIARAEQAAQAARRIPQRLIVKHLDEELDIDNAEHAQLRGYYDEIEDALRHDRYLVIGEPIHSLRGESDVRRFELLVRLVLPGGVRVSMPRFERHAHRLGLAGRIDRWMLTRSFELLAADPQLEVEVNLGALSLTDPAIVELIEQGIGRQTFGPHQLLLALDEHVISEHPHETLEFAEQIREFGLRLAIDNYGTSPRSLQILETIDARRAKLTSDTLSTGTGAEDVLVRSTIQTAQQLGIEVAVPFATDEAALQRATDLGIDLVQGTAVGPPTIFD